MIEQSSPTRKPPQDAKVTKRISLSIPATNRLCLPMRDRFQFAAIALACTLLLSGCGGGTAPATNFVSPPTTVTPGSTLQAQAAQKQIVYGVAAGSDRLNTDSAFAQQVGDNAGLLVPENELKWDTTEPQPGVFNFAPGDALLAFATQHHMLFRGHNLVWYLQTPAWAGADAATAQLQLVSHITAEVSHYAGHVHSWDVVNEPVEPKDGRADGLRNNAWLRSLGPGYIDTAFRAAAAADPNAVLVINDYGMEYDDSTSQARRNAMLALLQRLKQSGVPVGALGIQSHLNASQNSKFNAAKFQAFLQSVAALGLKIYITELDAVDAGLPADVTTRDARVAQAYSDFLNAALSNPAVTMVVTWGLTDRYTWLSSESPRSDGLAVRPLPLDTNLQPKPAYNAMLAAFSAATAR
jgi:endo-1,4-beta-xylanase